MGYTNHVFTKKNGDPTNWISMELVMGFYHGFYGKRWEYHVTNKKTIYTNRIIHNPMKITVFYTS